MKMHHMIVAVTLGLAAIAFNAACGGEVAGQDSVEPGSVSLFNGKDLDGWIVGPEKSWVVEDGVIALKREMDGKEHNADYLWTRQTYGDFILELEFKIPEHALVMQWEKPTGCHPWAWRNYV